MKHPSKRTKLHENFFNVPVIALSGREGSVQFPNEHVKRKNNTNFANMADNITLSQSSFAQLRSDNSEATTWKRQLGSDNLEATTWKRQLGSDNLEATTWKNILRGGGGG